MVTLLTITLRFLSATNLNKTLQRPCRYRTITARLSYNHRVIFTTSLYKLHDARTMTLRKSQGVGTLTVQLSCNYVHGFKLLSMFIFAFHLDYISKSCDHKSCYERPVFLVEHGPKVLNSVIRMCIFNCQFLSSAVFIKFKSQNIATPFYSTLL